MSVLEIVLISLVIIMVVMTAIAEPKASLEYGKAMFKSGLKLFDWAKLTTTKIANQVGSNTTEVIKDD